MPGRNPPLAHESGQGLTLPPLPNGCDALEPYLARRTLAVHHGEHHAAYVEKARAVVKGTPLAFLSREEIVRLHAAARDTVLRPGHGSAPAHGAVVGCAMCGSAH